MLRKFHLADLLRRKKYVELAKDLKHYPLGFELDKKMDLGDEKSIKSVLATIGISADNVTLWGTGEVYREFLHVDDMAEACVFLMEKCDYQDIGEIINIGTGEDIKLRQVAQLIREVVGFDGAIKYDSFKPDGSPRKLLDISRIKALGWKPKISLKTGLKKSYDWYVKSANN